MRSLVLILPFLMNLSVAFAENTDTLTVGYNVVPPFVTETKGGITGPSVWLWEKIAEENQLAFEYKRLPLDSLLWKLEYQELDVCLSPLSITSNRSKVIHFTSPYYIAHASILQRDDSRFEKSIAFITSFFSVNFFRALGALAFVIFIFGLLLWLFEKNKNQEEFGKGLKGLWEGFWWSAVTMTTVGYGDKSPRTVGGRIIALIWMFTAIIIISGFTASIASSLTLDSIGSSSSTIDDFKDETLGTIGNSATSQWLANNFYVKKKEYQNLEALLNALDKEKIDAIAYDRPILSNIIARDSLSRYKMIDTKYNPQFYAFGLNKALSETLKDSINFSMLNNIEKIDWKILLSENNLN